MAFAYKPKGRTIYRIEFKDQHGQRKKMSSGTNDKRMAESLGMKIEEDADRIRAGMPPIYGTLTEVPLGLVKTTRGVQTWKAFRQRRAPRVSRREAGQDHRERDRRAERVRADVPTQDGPGDRRADGQRVRGPPAGAARREEW